MKTSQYCSAGKNRCGFSARSKELSDRSSDRSANGRQLDRHTTVETRVVDRTHANAKQGNMHYSQTCQHAGTVHMRNTHGYNSQNKM